MESNGQAGAWGPQHNPSQAHGPPAGQPCSTPFIAIVEHTSAMQGTNLNCLNTFRLKHSGLVFVIGVPMLSVQPKGKQKGCAGCNRKIKDRYLLKALDKYWHEDCLKCACCDCRLGEVGSTLYTKANLILCRRDYLR